MTNQQLDRSLLELRMSLANALTVIDVIRELRPVGDYLLPNLHRELGTVQAVVRRARRLLPRS